MYELKLTINLIGWRSFVKRSFDPKFHKFAQKIYARDNYICQFCGFKAHSFQNIVNLDGNYSNNKEHNLITACCLCSQCLFLQATGLDDASGGQLIYLPEFKQAELNSFMHVVFVAMSNKTPMQEIAHTLYRNFRFRSQAIENKFGPGSSNPMAMAQMMLEYQDHHPDYCFDSLIKDLRLLPNYKKFSLQLATWAQSAEDKLEIR